MGEVVGIGESYVSVIYLVFIIELTLPCYIFWGGFFFFFVLPGGLVGGGFFFFKCLLYV